MPPKGAPDETGRGRGRGRGGDRGRGGSGDRGRGGFDRGGSRAGSPARGGSRGGSPARGSSPALGSPRGRPSGLRGGPPALGSPRGSPSGLRGGPGGPRGGPPRGGPPRGGGPPQGPPPPTGGAPAERRTHAVASHVRAIGAKRPGHGTAGRVVDIFTNHFATTLEQGIIYHYDGTHPFLSQNDVSDRPSLHTISVQSVGTIFFLHLYTADYSES